MQRQNALQGRTGKINSDILRLKERENEVEFTVWLQSRSEILLFWCFTFFHGNAKPSVSAILYFPTFNLEVKFLALGNSHMLLFFP